MSPSQTPPPLRRIAVHVEEARAGRFAWVLSELSPKPDAAWTAIRQSRTSADTYRQAMADGLLALQALVDDLDLGPRQEDATLVPSAKGRKAAVKEDAEPAPAPGARTAFGFGLIG